MRPVQKLIAAVFISSTCVVYAGTCELNVTRTACPQKEEFSYRKCGGKASCTVTIAKTTASECLDLARQACANPTPLVTKNKQISAKFDSEDLRTSDGHPDLCREYPKRDREFDRC